MDHVIIIMSDSNSPVELTNLLLYRLCMLIMFVLQATAKFSEKMRYIVALYGYMVGTNYLLVFILLVFMYWKILRWIRILREQNRTLFILVFLERLFTAVFQEHAEVRLNTELLICFCWEARLKREREWSTSSQCSPSPDLEVCILPCRLISLMQWRRLISLMQWRRLISPMQWRRLISLTLSHMIALFLSIHRLLAWVLVCNFWVNENPPCRLDHTNYCWERSPRCFSYGVLYHSG